MRHPIIIDDGSEELVTRIAPACDICGKVFERSEWMVTVSSNFGCLDVAGDWVAHPTLEPSAVRYCAACHREYIERWKKLHSDLVSTRRKA